MIRVAMGGDHATLNGRVRKRLSAGATVLLRLERSQVRRFGTQIAQELFELAHTLRRARLAGLGHDARWNFLQRVFQASSPPTVRPDCRPWGRPDRTHERRRWLRASRARRRREGRWLQVPQGRARTCACGSRRARLRSSTSESPCPRASTRRFAQPHPDDPRRACGKVRTRPHRAGKRLRRGHRHPPSPDLPLRALSPARSPARSATVPMRDASGWPRQSDAPRRASHPCVRSSV